MSGGQASEEMTKVPRRARGHPKHCESISEMGANWATRTRTQGQRRRPRAARDSPTGPALVRPGARRYLGPGMSQSPTIFYTETYEAPYLATFSLLPIIRAYAKVAGV